MRIGNDLVDLTVPEATGRSRDERFLRRVCTPSEIERIGASADPDRMLWVHWAAKEAAFKVVRKIRPGAPFAHRVYEFEPDAGGEALPEEAADPWSAGRVRVLDRVSGEEAFVLPVRWETTEELVHCLAWDRRLEDGFQVWTAVEPLAPEDHDLSAGFLTERERVSVRLPQSRGVRRLARRLAREAGCGEVEIVRVPGERGAGPPRMHRLGEAHPVEGWDLSLSHDGRFVGAALSGRKAPAVVPVRSPSRVGTSPAGR